MKKLFEEILLEYRCNVKESYAWVAERRIATLERTNKNEEGSTDRPMTSSKKKRKLKHLPTSLPYCLSWQTSDLGLSEWGTYNWSLKLNQNSSFSSEQLKLVAWLDLASQDQVTAASRWAPAPTQSTIQKSEHLTKTISTSSSRFYRSSKPVHPKHGHLVPTPGDWWDHPHEQW